MANNTPFSLFPVLYNVFFFSTPVRICSGDHAVSYAVDSGAVCRGIQRPGSESDHLKQSGVEVEPGHSYIRTPSVCIHFSVWYTYCLIKPKDPSAFST
jgi:hypothetical protein